MKELRLLPPPGSVSISPWPLAATGSLISRECGGWLTTSLYHDTDQARPPRRYLPTLQPWEPDTVIPTSPVSLSPVLVVRTPRSSQDNRPAPVRRLGRLAAWPGYIWVVSVYKSNAPQQRGENFNWSHSYHSYHHHQSGLSSPLAAQTPIAEAIIR